MPDVMLLGGGTFGRFLNWEDGMEPLGGISVFTQKISQNWQAPFTGLQNKQICSLQPKREP